MDSERGAMKGSEKPEGPKPLVPVVSDAASLPSRCLVVEACLGF